MRVHILQENLLRAVGALSRLTTSGGKLPILSHVLFQARTEGLWLSATDLELSVTLKMGAKVEEEGEVAVPARILGEFLGSLTAGKLSLATEGEQLRLVSGEHVATLNGMSAKEFPQIPTELGKKLFAFGEDFDEVVLSVAMAAAIDESRPVLTGVKWKQEDGKLQMIATDGYRLSLRTVEIESIRQTDKKEGKKVWVVPARALQEVAQIVKGFKYDDKVVVGLTEDGNQLLFQVGEVVVVSRLLADEFPNVEQIIPQGGETKVEVSQGELVAAVKMAAIFARESANIVNIAVEKEGLVIRANSPQVGENQSRVEAAVEGRQEEIAFNSRYLLDLLTNVKAKSLVKGAKEKQEISDQGKIVFMVNGPLAPGLFTFEGMPGFVHVIMPVRVQGEKRTS